MPISLKLDVKNKKESAAVGGLLPLQRTLYALRKSVFLVKQTSEFLKYLFLKRHVRLEAL